LIEHKLEICKERERIVQMEIVWNWKMKIYAMKNEKGMSWRRTRIRTKRKL